MCAGAGGGARQSVNEEAMSMRVQEQHYWCAVLAEPDPSRPVLTLL